MQTIKVRNNQNYKKTKLQTCNQLIKNNYSTKLQANSQQWLNN